MINSQDKVNRLLAGLDSLVGDTFKLENGVCALCDNDGREAIVIESPDNGEMLILHSEVTNIAGEKNASFYKSVLEKNFSVGEMKGCWLAVDNDTVRLCTQRTISDMDENRFRNLVSGFINLGLEWRQKFQMLSRESMNNKPNTVSSGNRAAQARGLSSKVF